MNTIQIKPVLINDLTLLRNIAIQSYCDHYLHLWYDGGDWYLKKCFTVAVLEEEFNNENSCFFIAWLNNEPAGFLKINKHAAWGEINAEDGLELERVYLTNTASGKGIGKQLIDITLAMAKDLNKKFVWLKAMDSSKEAIAFYHKAGFELCGTHYLDFEQMKEEYRSMVVMRNLIPAFS
jgi:ribosomal protein S18 acetylase RimI-like enzyme